MRTICEVLGELYSDAVARNDIQSVIRIEEAALMARRMQDKLKRYSLKTKDRTTLTAEHGWMNKEEYKARSGD